MRLNPWTERTAKTCTEKGQGEERKRRGQGEGGTDKDGTRHGGRGRKCSHVLRFIELDYVALVEVLL